MHEYSLCQRLLDQTLSIAENNHATKIKHISLQIGPLTGMEPELIKSGFTHVAENTIASAATLSIVKEPFKILCKTCHRHSNLDSLVRTCPVCDSDNTQLLNGDVLTITNLEIVT